MEPLWHLMSCPSRRIFTNTDPTSPQKGTTNLYSLQKTWMEIPISLHLCLPALAILIKKKNNHKTQLSEIDDLKKKGGISRVLSWIFKLVLRFNLASHVNWPFAIYSPTFGNCQFLFPFLCCWGLCLSLKVYGSSFYRVNILTFAICFTNICICF